MAPALWSLIAMWSAWRRLGGMPGPGPVEDQNARLVDAFAILDFEQELIQAYHQEVAERRAKGDRNG